MGVVPSSLSVAMTTKPEIENTIASSRKTAFKSLDPPGVPSCDPTPTLLSVAKYPVFPILPSCFKSPSCKTSRSVSEKSPLAWKAPGIKLYYWETAKTWQMTCRQSNAGDPSSPDLNSVDLKINNRISASDNVMKVELGHAGAVTKLGRRAIVREGGRGGRGTREGEVLYITTTTGFQLSWTETNPSFPSCLIKPTSCINTKSGIQGLYYPMLL